VSLRGPAKRAAVSTPRLANLFTVRLLAYNTKNPRSAIAVAALERSAGGESLRPIVFTMILASPAVHVANPGSLTMSSPNPTSPDVRVDIVTLTCPLTPEAEGMIRAGALTALKQGASLINVERGKVADEAALLTALADGQVRAGALDCFLRAAACQIRFRRAADAHSATYSRRDGAPSTERLRYSRLQYRAPASGGPALRNQPV
jgi:hypothetical protein